MDHFEPQANGYEEALIRDSTVSVISRLYQRERRKLCKKSKSQALAEPGPIRGTDEGTIGG